MHQKPPLEQIEAAAYNLNRARALLSERVTLLQDELTAAQKTHLQDIKKCVALAAKLHAELFTLIQQNRAAFTKPKSRILHGIECGYRKLKGTIEIPNPEQTVKLIEREYADNPDLLALLVIIDKHPSKKAIADLPVADAKKIGCSITPATDAIVLRPVDGEVEKTVKALLASAVEDKAPAKAESRK